MKICVVQTRPIQGSVEQNIEAHLNAVNLAAKHEANCIFFPELSLTGYEPKLAKELASTKDDPRLTSLKALSSTYNLLIGLGMPLQGEKGIEIGMILLLPHRPPLTYSKQYLHEDEVPYFVHGKGNIVLSVSKERLSPAICYESLLPAHATRAAGFGSNVYVASVAKPQKGIEKAYQHFPDIAKRHGMHVVMSNCIGPSDDFISAGQSAVWSSEGKLISSLDETTEGLIIYDTITGEAIELAIN